MKIGNFEPLEAPMELPSENAVPARAQSASNAPLEAFPADGILPAQTQVLNLGESSPHLPTSLAPAGEIAQVGTQPQQRSASEIPRPGDLTPEKQLELQQLMEKKTQIESTLSNVLMPFENTQSDLVDNLK